MQLLRDSPTPMSNDTEFCSRSYRRASELPSSLFAVYSDSLSDNRHLQGRFQPRYHVIENEAEGEGLVLAECCCRSFQSASERLVDSFRTLSKNGEL